MKRLLLVGALVLSACGTTAIDKPAATTAPPTPGLSPTTSALPSATTSTLPLGRWAAAMAYDRAHHTVVLFGGTSGQAPLGDTWTWDGSNWTEIRGLTLSPSPRSGAAMAFDEVHQDVILFGGLGSNGPLDDTWAWNGSAWQQLRPAHGPSRREDAVAIYDPVLSAVVLFGGMDDSKTPPGPINETWSWNGNDWALLKVQSPPGGIRPRLGFLAGANLVERFGDCQAGHDSTLYGFDGHTWVPKTVSGSQPPALCLPSLAGDAGRSTLVLFGGDPQSAASPVPADTWVYNGNTWSNARPSQAPPARKGASMVYDSDSGLLVLFGGQGLNPGTSGPLNDTWTWDGSTWTPHQ